MTNWWLVVLTLVGAAGCGLVAVVIAWQLGLGLGLPSAMFLPPWR